MSRACFAGQWHWDDARASIDACIAYLPDVPFRAALETADSRRADSSLVWRWGLSLGRLHGLEAPAAYATAVTDSAAIHRPSLSTRSGALLPSGDQVERWADFKVKARASARLPLGEEP